MKKKYIIVALVLLILIISGVVIIKYQKQYQQTDLYRFNNEYHILANSPVKYLDLSNVKSIFNKEEAFIYIGSANDETCRNIVPILLETVNKYQLKDFYYLNIDDEQSLYEVKDNKAVKIKDGSENYYQLLELLDPFLGEYTIIKDNKEYKTGEKRIKIPFVISIKDGNIDNYHESTIKLNSDQEYFDIKNNEQRLKLIDIYSDLISNIVN